MKENIFKYLTTWESLYELKADNRGWSRTTTMSGVELFVAIVNSFYQVTTIQRPLSWMYSSKSVPEYPGLDDKAFQLSISYFLKVDNKHYYFFISC